MNNTKKFVITAGTLTGNRGAEAMVTTCIEQIKKRFHNCNIIIATYYPNEDIKELKKLYSQDNNLYIYSITPKNLLFNWLPLSVIGKIFPFLQTNKLRNFGSILDLLNVDAVFDVAGVSFIDSRIKFLPFNILTIFPFIFHGIKVYKMPQAIGPINNIINSLSAKLILSKCRKIYARGEMTKKLIDDSKIKIDCKLAPDISFSMNKKIQNSNFEDFSTRKENKILIIPSSLVMNKSKNYINLLVNLIVSLKKIGVRADLLVHSWRNSKESRNNDVIAAMKINKFLDNEQKIIGVEMNSKELREEISKYKLCLTSRFHGMIGCLDTYTPLIIIGWSHKYLEVLRMFNLDESYCFDYKKTELIELMALIKEVFKNSHKVSNQIKDRLPKIKLDSNKMFNEIFEDIEMIK